MTHEPTPESLIAGSIVGPWRIDRFVGQGTYGVVFRATRAGHPRSGPVALKVAIYPQDRRFGREVELLKRIRHPAVPELVDRGWWQAGSGQVHPYIVMQWAEGLPLYEWVRVYNPTSRLLLQVVAQVARALEATHREGCLHRDVKGDNIRVGAGGQAFLMDFGSGTWAGAPLLTEGIMPPSTNDYRSHAALRFRWYYRHDRHARYEASEADDLYALGVSAYRAATGVHPPLGTDPEAREDSHRSPPPERLPPQALNERVVPELAGLIEQMLSEVPQARGSAREVAKAAEAAALCAGPTADLPLVSSSKGRAEARPEPEKAAGPRARVEERAPLLPTMCSLLVIMGVVWLSDRCYGQGPEVARAEAADGGTQGDRGTVGLGDRVRTSYEDFPDGLAARPDASTAFRAPLPRQPFPNQIRPNAGGKCPLKAQLAINGGCWLIIGNSQPPCEDAGLPLYEWQGACYQPVYASPRQPASEEP